MARSKYSSLQEDINAIFASQPWLDLQIETHPEGFVGNTYEKEYVVVTIIASEPKTSITSVSGQILIDIYIPAGLGLKRAYEIADLLDEQMAGKVLYNTLAGTTQLGSSSLQGRGTDKDNQSLYRAIYSIPFTFFGV